VKGRVGQRNAPTVLNALYNKKQFWDGRTETLEDQATMPITNPSEMGQASLETAVATLRAIAEYKEEFEHVFGQDPTGLTLVRAIAAYERTLLSFDSPFDHFIAGDPNAIENAAKRGRVLFNSSKIHAEVEDPVVLVLWVSVANGKLVAYSQGPR
jgi:cytochrome c peroxidase